MIRLRHWGAIDGDTFRQCVPKRVHRDTGVVFHTTGTGGRKPFPCDTRWVLGGPDMSQEEFCCLVASLLYSVVFVCGGSGGVVRLG